jgi:hypothetical protein
MDFCVSIHAPAGGATPYNFKPANKTFAGGKSLNFKFKFNILTNYSQEKTKPVLTRV